MKYCICYKWINLENMLSDNILHDSFVGNVQNSKSIKTEHALWLGTVKVGKMGKVH